MLRKRNHGRSRELTLTSCASSWAMRLRMCWSVNRMNWRIFRVDGDLLGKDFSRNQDGQVENGVAHLFLHINSKGVSNVVECLTNWGNLVIDVSLGTSLDAYTLFSGIWGVIAVSPNFNLQEMVREFLLLVSSFRRYVLTAAVRLSQSSICERLSMHFLFSMKWRSTHKSLANWIIALVYSIGFKTPSWVIKLLRSGTGASPAGGSSVLRFLKLIEAFEIWLRPPLHGYILALMQIWQFATDFIHRRVPSGDHLNVVFGQSTRSGNNQVKIHLQVDFSSSCVTFLTSKDRPFDTWPPLAIDRQRGPELASQLLHHHIWSLRCKLESYVIGRH